MFINLLVPDIGGFVLSKFSPSAIFWDIKAKTFQKFYGHIVSHTLKRHKFGMSYMFLISLPPFTFTN